MNPEYSRFVMRLFEFYLRIRIFFNFHTVHYDLGLTRAALRADLPTIFVANHISWWDGFFIILLRRQLIGASLHHSVMLNSELAKFPFLKKIGCLGISPKSKDSISSVFLQIKSFFELSTSASLAYFPQGEITPLCARPLLFKKGIEHLLKILPDCQIIPVALHIEPLRFMKPTAYIKTGPPILNSEKPITALELKLLIEDLLADVTLRQPLATLKLDQKQ